MNIIETNGYCETDHRKRKRAMVMVDGVRCCYLCSLKNATHQEKKILRGIKNRKKSSMKKARKESCGNFRRRSEKAKKYIFNLRSRATKGEMAMKSLLDAAKIKHKFQRAFIKKGAFVIVDFYINKGKIAIEVDGGYHDTDHQKSKDAWKEKYLIDNYKVKTIRFTNKQVYNLTVEQLKQAISSPKKTTYAI